MSILTKVGNEYDGQSLAFCLIDETFSLVNSQVLVCASNTDAINFGWSSSSFDNIFSWPLLWVHWVIAASILAFSRFGTLPNRTAKEYIYTKNLELNDVKCLLFICVRCLCDERWAFNIRDIPSHKDSVGEGHIEDSEKKILVPILI